MRMRDLRGVAQNLAAMACSERRMSADFECLAGLPDGEVSFDLVAGAVTHSEIGPISMAATQELIGWLRETGVHDLEFGRVVLRIDTSTPPTHRSTLISFRFDSTVILGINGRRFTGAASNHLYHNRPAQQGTARDGFTAREF